MKRLKYIQLKSTGQLVHELEWIAQSKPPYNTDKYMRVLIPAEHRGHAPRIEVVRKTALKEVVLHQEIADKAAA